jgi:hypothetical protein
MVQIDRPIWYSRQLCPVCRQGPSLVFCTCPHCGHVLLECAEEGTVFANPRELSAGGQNTGYSSEDCPQCHTYKVREFRPATSADLQAAGYGSSEYQ